MPTQQPSQPKNPNPGTGDQKRNMPSWDQDRNRASQPTGPSSGPGTVPRPDPAENRNRPDSGASQGDGHNDAESDR